MCNDCMHNKMNNCESEMLSSFLGGLFLVRKSISNMEFLELLDKFQNYYNVNVIDDKMCISVGVDNSSLTLLNNYDDIIVYNKKKMFVRDYLYIIASKNVKEFFDIPINRGFVCNLCSTVRRRILKLKNI